MHCLLSLDAHFLLRSGHASVNIFYIFLLAHSVLDLGLHCLLRSGRALFTRVWTRISYLGLDMLL